jgi:transposase
VFRNARRDRLKLLWWDRDGLALFYKRLEKGSYQFPTDTTARTSNRPAGDQDNSRRCEIRTDELSLLLDGIDLSSVKRRPRYERPANTPSKAPASSL